MLRPKRHRPLKPIPVWKGEKPKLPMTASLVCRVHFRALEAYLFKVLRMRDYDIRLATGARGDMVPEYIVDGSTPPASNIGQQLDNIRRGRRTKDLGLVLNVLCMDGFIPIGKYVIDTCEDMKPINSYAELLNMYHDPLHPICLAWKAKHKNDKDFMRRTKALDLLMIEAIRQEGENTL